MYVCNKYQQPKHISGSFALCWWEFYLIYLRSWFGSASPTSRKDLYCLGAFLQSLHEGFPGSFPTQKEVICLQLSLKFSILMRKLEDEGAQQCCIRSAATPSQSKAVSAAKHSVIFYRSVKWHPDKQVFQCHAAHQPPPLGRREELFFPLWSSELFGNCKIKILTKSRLINLSKEVLATPCSYCKSNRNLGQEKDRFVGIFRAVL